MKNPYTFPHKSRSAIVAYLMDRQSRSYHYQTYRFAFCVKTYGAEFDGESLRKRNPDLEPRFDAQWEDLLELDSSLFWTWCEDAARYIGKGEWTSYPGDDQGDWAFSFEGRCGGWIVLDMWRGYDMRNPDAQDLAEMDWPDLVSFYRGIRCAEQDFTPDNASAEIEYQAAFFRETWEDDLRDDEEQQAVELAEAIQDSRPDLLAA